MPAAPFIDFEDLDLSEVVVGRDVLNEYLRQRNRFAVLDGIVHEDVPGEILVGYKEIRGDDWWATDHIPGKPMFPGVLQIELAAQIAAYDYSAHRIPAEVSKQKFVGFGGVENARFRQLVVPDCRLLMAVSLEKHSSRMFRYSAQGYVDRQIVFEGHVIGVLVGDVPVEQ